MGRSVGKGGDEQKVNSFKTVLIAICGQKGTSEVLEQARPVGVEFVGADRKALIDEHTEEVVLKS